MKNKKGFTLIELLAVITIMGILIIIAIPAFSKVIERSRKKTFITQVQLAVKSIKAMHISEENAVYLFSDLDEDIKSPFGGNIEGIVIFDNGQSYVFAIDSNGKVLDSTEERSNGDVVIPVNTNDINISNIHEISERGGSGGLQQQIGSYVSINSKIYFISSNKVVTEVNNIYIPGTTVNLSIKSTGEIVEGLVLSRNGKHTNVLLPNYYHSPTAKIKASVIINNLKKPAYFKNMLLRDYDRGEGTISVDDIHVLSVSDINSWANTQGYEGKIVCNASYIQNTFSVEHTKAIIAQLGLNIQKDGKYYTTFFLGEDTMCYFPENVEENNTIVRDDNALGQFRVVVALDEDKCLINREECVWPQTQ